MSPDVNKESIEYIIGQIDTKIDQILANQEKHNERLESHGGRLKKLEKTKAWAIGVAAGIGLLGSYIKEWLPK